VRFNGSGHQYVNSSENFNILEANMGNALRVANVAHTVTCNQYDWTSGGIDVLAGTFTALDLVDNGLNGEFWVNPGGTINLHQDASSYIDLNGKLFFTNGGTINIYGGSDISWWPFQGNAEINMNGGVLDFKDRGINIYNSSTYSFAHNITGGTIRTSGSLLCNRTDFTPAGGTFEFYGSNDVFLNMVSGSKLRNVIIDKSSMASGLNLTDEPVYDQRSGQLLSDGTRSNKISLNSNIDILGNLTINTGRLNTLSSQVSVSGNVAVNNGGQLSVGAGGGIAMSASKSVTVNNGGLIEFNGTSGMQSKITRNSSGYYALDIESGGKIAAEHAIFEYMNTNGVNIKSGAIVDVGKSFTSCIFRNGQSGGRLLTINNNQTFSVNYAMFPNNSWGGNFNVYKSVNSGVVTFGGYSGGFSGGSYEYDPNNRIHWGGEVAGNVTLQGVDVVNGQDICFDATNTLTIAGGGTTFIVQNGGNVNLIAGHNIRMLEGTSVRSGAYLHAYISNDYCALPILMLAVNEDSDSNDEIVSEKSAEDFETQTDDFFRVYPNPTNGRIMLEFSEPTANTLVEVYGLIGERILAKEISGYSLYELDLTLQPQGIYLVKVSNGNSVVLKKIIKK
ncbi:MAG: T9SS type A sorting domain-containing protein, partial [Bacteroidales bacterium]